MATKLHLIGVEKHKHHSDEEIGEVAHHEQEGNLARVRNFVLHYIEMALVMCIGGFALNFMFFTAIAQVGYVNMLERYPEFSILAIGVLLAIPMAAWMRYRGHDLRTNLEMSSTSIILAVALVGAAGLGVLPRGSMFIWLKSLACPIMLIPMLLRLDHYTESHARHRKKLSATG